MRNFPNIVEPNDFNPALDSIVMMVLTNSYKIELPVFLLLSVFVDI